METARDPAVLSMLLKKDFHDPPPDDTTLHTGVCPPRPRLSSHSLSFLYGSLVHLKECNYQLRHYWSHLSKRAKTNNALALSSNLNTSSYIDAPYVDASRSTAVSARHNGYRWLGMIAVRLKLEYTS